MIVKHLEDVIGTAADVDTEGWNSRRLLYKDAGMGYSVNDTLIKQGHEMEFEYRNHLEQLVHQRTAALLELRSVGDWPVGIAGEDDVPALLERLRPAPHSLAPSTSIQPRVDQSVDQRADERFDHQSPFRLSRTRVAARLTVKPAQGTAAALAIRPSVVATPCSISGAAHDPSRGPRLIDEARPNPGRPDAGCRGSCREAAGSRVRIAVVGRSGRIHRAIEELARNGQRLAQMGHRCPICASSFAEVVTGSQGGSALGRVVLVVGGVLRIGFLRLICLRLGLILVALATLGCEVLVVLVLHLRHAPALPASVRISPPPGLRGSHFRARALARSFALPMASTSSALDIEERPSTSSRLAMS